MDMQETPNGDTAPIPQANNVPIIMQIWFVSLYNYYDIIIGF